MSLLVRYTLKSADDHNALTQAMKALVSGLTDEGATGFTYSCFSTGEPARFHGLLEFETDAGKQTFLDSAAFATYRETVGQMFANPPETTDITAIASTRS